MSNLPFFTDNLTVNSLFRNNRQNGDYSWGCGVLILYLFQTGYINISVRYKDDHFNINYLSPELQPCKMIIYVKMLGYSTFLAVSNLKSNYVISSF